MNSPIDFSQSSSRLSHFLPLVRDNDMHVHYCIQKKKFVWEKCENPFEDMFKPQLSQKLKKRSGHNHINKLPLRQGPDSPLEIELNMRTS